MERIKTFCENLYYLARDNKNNKNRVLNIEGQCYGAVMFYFNVYGFDEEVAEWWENDFLPRIREIIYS